MFYRIIYLGDRKIAHRKIASRKIAPPQRIPPWGRVRVRGKLPREIFQGAIFLVRPRP